MELHVSTCQMNPYHSSTVEIKLYKEYRVLSKKNSLTYTRLFPIIHSSKLVLLCGTFLLILFIGRYQETPTSMR